MSLLTPEQRAIFDETVRLRALEVLNGGEEPIASALPPDARHGDHPHPHKPGSRVKKAEQEQRHRAIKTAAVDEANPVFALDSNDPNYDSSEEPNHTILKAIPRAFPRTDVIVAYKASTASIVKEYFDSGDVAATAALLDDTEQPLYQHYFVKRLVTMSMDRGAKEKEAAAVLLSALYPNHVSSLEIQRGFERLVESVDDLALDVPSAASDLAMFIARATVDDILPPAFMHTLEGLLPGLRGEGKHAFETLRIARGHLDGRHAHERVLRGFGVDSSKSPIDAAKTAIQDLLTEYLDSGDVAEARRCLRAINARYFHHEFVKRALVLCIEAVVGDETAPRLLGLLKVLGSSGEVSASQMALGFDRMAAVVEDLKLDVPNAETRMEGLRLMAKEEGIHPMRD